MPSTTSRSSVSRLFGFLDGDNALVADLLHRLGDLLADHLLAVGGNRADLGDLLVGRDLGRALLDVRRPRPRPRGRRRPLQVHRVHAGGHRLGAFALARWPGPAPRSRWWCRRRPRRWSSRRPRAPSARPCSRTCRPSSISLATVTPSLVMRGAPNDLSSTTLRPFGPSVTLTASARMLTPRSIRSRASLENFTSLAAILLVPFDSRSGDHAHDVGLFHDDQLLAVELDLGARPFAEQHPVALLDVEQERPCRPRRGRPCRTAMTLPSIGFSLAVSGMMIPPLVFCLRSLTRCLSTRSCNGRNAMEALLDLTMVPMGPNWHSRGKSAA